jgi:TrmH family RNA methyltransferase
MARKPTLRTFPLDRLAVVLVATRNPLNIGAVARAMSNFGFTDLRTVKPYELAFREAKSAVGAAELLSNAREYATLADAVADCSLVVGTTAGRNRQLDHELKPLRDGAAVIRRRLGSGKVAVLFGSEKRGLSNEDLSHCHWLMRIPTVEKSPSMNLGQAAALCLYELARAQTPAARPDPPSRATSAELDRLASVLTDALTTSGYLKQGRRSAETESIRRLLRRLNLSTEDAQTLLGMLRQMLWKMQALK